MRNWVANHYIGRIEKAFVAEGFRPTSLAIVTSATPAPVIGGGVPREAQHQGPGENPTNASYISPRSESRTNEGDKGLWNRMLHPQQTFDSFIPGAANQFGHGAARSFADGQQADIPLLYIHGGFGFGKTHLLNAAALEFRKRGKRTLFLRAEDFMRHFLGALYRKDTLAFKEELRTAEVLIIDDLQHICRSAATASEFLYTVNAFADLRRRVVIAADRPPQ
ncbi:MAG: DnaA/Hda family protein, partial [Alphaproteobacteria bacterium]|nr:DnaA/Hda family protein [Alphaproteobacteria bacterium]